jgi:hypothetical protein
MIDESKLAAVELTLLECGEWLRGVPPGPAVRELRVRLGALTRVVSSWRIHPPHAAQLVAMLECAMELRALVARACAPGVSDTLPPTAPVDPQISQTRSRPPPARSTAWPRRVVRTARPPARDAASRTTRPPARRRSSGG